MHFALNSRENSDNTQRVLKNTHGVFRKSHGVFFESRGVLVFPLFVTSVSFLYSDDAKIVKSERKTK